MAWYRRTMHNDFYPRSPCGERLEEVEKLSRVTVISIHALLAESDTPVFITSDTIMISIHALLAESDGTSVCMCITWPIFLSTLSLRRATLIPGAQRQLPEISIHALLAESDYVPLAVPDLGKRFLSTLSLRRATLTYRRTRRFQDISIHALLAESDQPMYL